MHFFKKQQVDQAGVVGVALQKILIFLMVVNFIGGLFGGFFSSLITFALLMVGFMGAYRRRPTWLTAYFSISLTIMVLVSIVLLMVVIAFATMPPATAASEDRAMTPSSGPTTTPQSFKTLKAALSRQLFQADTNNSSSSSDSESSDSYDYSDDDDEAEMSFFLMIFVLFFSFFALYCKIYSMVLAWRMRNMLLASTQPFVLEAAQSQEPTDTTPLTRTYTNTNSNPPMFVQPGFIPYGYAPIPQMGNMNMNHGQVLMQPPISYGQQPIFYTFAPMPPMPQQHSINNEKL